MLARWEVKTRMGLIEAAHRGWHQAPIVSLEWLFLYPADPEFQGHCEDVDYREGYTSSYDVGRSLVVVWHGGVKAGPYA